MIPITLEVQDVYGDLGWFTEYPDLSKQLQGIFFLLPVVRLGKKLPIYELVFKSNLIISPILIHDTCTSKVDAQMCIINFLQSLGHKNIVFKEGIHKYS